MTRVTNEHLADFSSRLTLKITSADEPHPVFEVMHGVKYARIVRTDGGQRYAYAFIDLTNGNILKPDGWKRPAKHARGNIFAADPLVCCGPYGVAYLR